MCFCRVYNFIPYQKWLKCIKYQIFGGFLALSVLQMGPMQNLVFDLEASCAHEMIHLWQDWMGRGILRIKMSLRISTTNNYQCLCFFSFKHATPCLVQNLMYLKKKLTGQILTQIDSLLQAVSIKLLHSCIKPSDTVVSYLCSHQKVFFLLFSRFWHVSTLKTRSYWQSQALTHQNNTF